MERPASLLVATGDRAHRSVALLPGEAAGSLATRTAGAVEFEATLSWRRHEDVPSGPVIPEPDGAARCSIAETGEPGVAMRRLTAEIRAFTPRELGSALQATLRSLTAVAALTEAMLEVQAVRTVPPRVASRPALEELARDLWRAGFCVRFGPSWAPALRAADAYAGSGGGEVIEVLRAMHPSWSIA